MSRLILSIQLCLLLAVCPSTALALFNGYQALSDWESFARFEPGTLTGLATSYDRAGDNYDFNNYESPEGFRTDARDTVTVVTIDGPGVLTRFWMPHASAYGPFNVKMYIDGETQPSIDTDNSQLLAGNYGYFQDPLVSTSIGGQVSYEPVVFSQSLKIETNNFGWPVTVTQMNYYQYSYHKLPPTTQVVPYTGTLTPEQITDRNAAVAMINNLGQNPAGTSATSTIVPTATTNIAPGQTLTLTDLTGPGLIKRLNLKMTSPTDQDMDGLRLRIRYDGQTDNAVDIPVSHFFGAGHERTSYKSMPLGTDSPDGFYSYWPMPFHKAAVVELYNSTASTIDIDSAAIEYEPGTVPADSLYFHAIHDEELTTASQQYHMMLDVEGTGHYVGNFLYVQQDTTDRAILEGDNVIIADGRLLHGTGLEDAYNGGFYYNHGSVILDTLDDPEKPEFGIKPYHGLLHMDDADFDDTFLRADQYRWLISDYVPFDENIEVKIENMNGGENVLFGSTAFYYLMPDLPGDVNGDGYVGGLDLTTIITSWGMTGATRQQGDLNGDGTISGPDYTEVVTYWGTGVPPEPPAGIPEPATLTLLLMGTFLLISRRQSV